MNRYYSLFCIAMMLAVASCQDQDNLKNEIPSNIISQLKVAGFDTSEGLTRYKNGYLVEYDVFLTEAQIADLSEGVAVSQEAEEEHYRTYNLVTSTPRTLKVFMHGDFGSYMQSAFDRALSRYNALNMNLSFQRTSIASDADIQILAFYENSNTLGYSAGFPTGGNPASPIQLNTRYYNNTSSRADAATVIAHEIGHAIGFRHTDYMARRFSCGSGGNEGSAGVGAVYIPGTPKRGEAGSYMLACSNGTDRPFTSGDITALTTVY